MVTATRTTIRSASPPTRVLVVEDDPNSRWVLSCLLTRLGFDCRVAEDGREAIEIAGTFRPEIILMDLMLPVLSGLEATRRLKSNCETRSIPVVATSADDTPEGRAGAASAGCDDFLAKPIVLEELIRRVRKLLRPRSSF